jgi:hypothetical protein
VAGRPLRPATRHSLGGPLPHQLADRPWAHSQVIAQPESKATFYRVTWVTWSYPVLAPLSRGYPKLKHRLPMYYSPVRRFTHPRRDFHARLACVRHATSVRSEPGSNSQINLKLNCTFRTKNRGLTILLSKSKKTSDTNLSTLLHPCQIPPSGESGTLQSVLSRCFKRTNLTLKQC